MADFPQNPEIPPLPSPGPRPNDYFDQFLLELEGINKHLKAARAEMPDQFASKMREVADFYIEGMSKKASTPGSSSAPPGLGDSGGSSRGYDPFRVQMPQMSEHELRQALGQRQRSQARRVSDDELASQGGVQDSSTASNPPPPKPAASRLSDDQWRRAHEVQQMPALQMLRLADSSYTVQDALEVAAKGFNKYVYEPVQGPINAAQARVDSAATEQELYDALFGEGGVEDQQGRQARADQLGRYQSWIKKGYDLAPATQMVSRFLQSQGIHTNPGYYAEFGARQGYSAEGGGISIPGTGVGLRIPFANAAAQAGIRREWEIQKMRSEAGINGEQARNIYDELNARGFTRTMDHGRFDTKETGLLGDIGGFLGGVPGGGAIKLGTGFFDGLLGGDTRKAPNGRNLQPGPSFDDMVNAAKEMTKKHPELVDSTYYDLMDKAVRTASTSLENFNNNMEQVQKVATETGYSMDQMKQDMMAVGDVTESMGGTHFGGQKLALDWQSNMRGVPAARLPELLQNPWVQSNAFLNSGLMPWQQGLQNSGMAMHNVTDAVGMLWDTVSPMKGFSKSMPGKAGEYGFKQTYQEEDLKAAQVAEMLGGDLTPQQVKVMMRNRKSYEARAGLLGASEAWSRNIGNIERDKTMSREEKDKAIKELMDRNAVAGGKYGGLIRLERESGFSPEERQRVHEAVDGKSGAKAASARYNEIKKILAEKDKALGEADTPKVIVELGPSAKKMLHIQDERSENKRNAQAATVSVNQMFGGGPSLMP